jgi:SAM-dependent MidA family methyltransferase
MTSFLHEDVSELPIPDATALAHSARLLDRIRSVIEAQGGHIGFDRYMDLALYEPGLGYYSAGASKFGVEGDFVTAPEISSLFSICLARQCRQILTESPDGVILELGAGTGRMAADILRALQRDGPLPARYLILETSADLCARQQRLLQREFPEFYGQIVWLDRLPETPVAGVILANEVMDALPVRRITHRYGRIHELCVRCKNGKITWMEAPATDELTDRVLRVIEQLRLPWQGTYTTEISFAIAPWIAALSACLRRGVIMLIDYGYPRSEYYHPDRTKGTLLCHYRHRVHADPFLYPGLQDITASVDFTAVAEAAAVANMEVAGYTTQAFFLLGCGLEEIMNAGLNGNVRQQLDLANQSKRLALPSEMGERYKVIALAKGMTAALLGFAAADLRRHL